MISPTRVSLAKLSRLAVQPFLRGEPFMIRVFIDNHLLKLIVSHGMTKCKEKFP